MELKELKEKVLELYEIADIQELKDAIEKNLNNEKYYEEFIKLIDGDLEKDWLQMIFQYYYADRQDKKQDYTPKSLAKLLSALCGDSDTCIDLCAGSGALTIQKWVNKPDTHFVCYELDKNVIPFLLFNLSVRNISADVIGADILSEEVHSKYKVLRGEKYGKVVNIKSAV